MQKQFLSSFSLSKCWDKLQNNWFMVLNYYLTAHLTSALKAFKVDKMLRMEENFRHRSFNSNVWATKRFNEVFFWFSQNLINFSSRWISVRDQNLNFHLTKRQYPPQKLDFHLQFIVLLFHSFSINFAFFPHFSFEILIARLRAFDTFTFN